MFKEIRVALFLSVVGVVCGPTFADTAVDFNLAGSVWGSPIGGSNHGWQFTVNQGITVSHLGLYDYPPDGFSADHPIGLWRLNDGTLLTSGTMHAGTVDPLTNHFRYIDVPDVQLSIGVNYVIGYYSYSDNSDKAITKAAGLQVSPAINLVVSRWDTSGQFQMPMNITPDEDEFGDPQPNPDAFGPNFKFEVPEPMTLLLLSLGGLLLHRRCK